MDGDQLLVGVVVEGNLIGNIHAYIVTADSFSTLSFPDNELVVVLAAERRQVLFVVGERETLDQNLVHLQTVLQFQGIEVPDDDISLETLVGLLATSNEFARAGANNDGDLVVVASEELLCSANNVSDDDCSAQREDDVLVIRVQNQALVDLALEANNCR